MARIRTIKPEFFTSEDIVSMSPLARLLYVALWCEADREGRLVWKPRTFKLRYFPADSFDIEALCKELTDSGLVVLYGDGLAVIPSFATHQHVNPRESVSTLPDPSESDASPRVGTRANQELHAQGGKEGEGREGKDRSASPSGSRLPADWKPDDEELRWARDARPDLSVTTEVEKFRDYWHAMAGAKGRKTDWKATWRNWIRNAHGTGGQPAKPAKRREML